MGTCRLCNGSGWFLQVSGIGLCNQCAFVHAMDLEQHSRIIGESINIIDNSKNLSTVLSRIDVALRSCDQLRRYEMKGIPTIVTSPSAAMVKIEQHRKAAISQAAKKISADAMVKAAAIPASASAARIYSKAIAKLADLYSLVKDVTEIEQIEASLKAEMDTAELKAQLAKAERAEFKGQKKKAIEAYLDALFLIRKDSIADQYQKSEINAIKQKISALGGEFPT